MNHIEGKRLMSLSRRLIALGALTISALAVAQQKTGPGIAQDESLTFHGITLYGVVDLGLQYETHGAPFSDYRPAASGNIVQKNSRQSVFGVTPSNEGQSRVGVQGDEHLWATGLPCSGWRHSSIRNQVRLPIR